MRLKTKYMARMRTNPSSLLSKLACIFETAKKSIMMTEAMTTTVREVLLSIDIMYP